MTPSTHVLSTCWTPSWRCLAKWGRTRLVTGPRRQCSHKSVPRPCGLTLSCNVGGNTTQIAETTTAELPDSAARWDSFVSTATGEWDGITATFDADGEAQPLDEYYVPQAFRDWGVVLYDWQSQCSMQCSGEQAGVTYTHRRMMPTVGCEADAIAFTSQQQQLFAGSSNAAVAADGSYSAGAAELPAGCDQEQEQGSTVAIEHCLSLQPGGKQRVRVIHNLRRGRHGSAGAWRVVSIVVHRERWDSPFNGRVELTGCGGGMEAFAEKPRVEAGSLGGAWSVSEGTWFVFDEAGECAEESTSGSSWSSSALGDDLVLLPLGLWASAKISPEEDGSVCVQVGALLEDGSMRVGSREYRSGRLSSASLQTLVRQ